MAVISNEVDQMLNKELKEELADQALTVLLNQKEIEMGDLEWIKCTFGYILNLPGHGLEALYKIIKDDKVWYFAFQQDTLRYIGINEEQFQSVTEHMIETHLK